MIDCKDCALFAYKLDAGEGQGKRILTGDAPIPVRHPPCHDDPDPASNPDYEFVCPKKKPGYCDFNEAAAEVYWNWRLCNSMDDHPPEMEARRFRRLLDKLQHNIENAREDSRMNELTDALNRVRRR